MSPALPEGDVGPRRRLAAGRRRSRVPTSARSASTCTCRSARCAAGTATSTPTRRPSWAAARASTRTRTRRCGRSRWPRRADACRRRPVQHRLRRRRHPDGPVGRRTSSRMLGGVRDAWGLAAGRRGHHRGQPRLGDAASRSPRWPAPGSRGSRSGCSPPCRTCWRTLDRTHDPRRIPDVVRWARDAGPGRVARPHLRHAGGVARRLARPASRRRSRRASTTCPRTRSSSRPARGWPCRCAAASSSCPTTTTRPRSTSWPTTCSTAAGLSWYEVSNWARTPADACRHNLGYWRGDDWWGIGPGAHSHVGGVRWWNVKHPRGVRRPARTAG